MLGTGVVGYEIRVEYEIKGCVRGQIALTSDVFQTQLRHCYRFHPGLKRSRNSFNTHPTAQGLISQNSATSRCMCSHEGLNDAQSGVETGESVLCANRGCGDGSGFVAEDLSGFPRHCGDCAGPNPNLKLNCRGLSGLFFNSNSYHAAEDGCDDIIN